MDREHALFIVERLTGELESKSFAKIESKGVEIELRNDGKHIILQIMNDGLAACLRVDNFSKYNLACLICKVVHA